MPSFFRTFVPDMIFLRKYILLTVLGMVCVQMSAQGIQHTDTVPVATSMHDSLTVSILTCTAGQDLYAKFGHTALRIQNYTTGLDIVFNYGCFDASSNNFVLKFILGQTDYLLQAEHFMFFVGRYQRYGIGVTEQCLNLTANEKERLFSLLQQNLQPENQEYRYNWLYDNCTERARDVVAKAIDGKVTYNRETTPTTTVRQLLHQCLADVPWTEFGIDMILGAEIDKPEDKEVLTFLPEEFRAEANAARITATDGTERSYADESQTLLPATPQPEQSNPLTTPLAIFTCLMLAIMLLATLEMFKWKKQQLWVDVLLHTAQGLAGTLVAFLFFFSVHAGVNTNWLVIIFNPLMLFYAGWLIRCSLKKKKNTLAYVNLMSLGAFLCLMPVCPQSFNTAMYPLVITLFVRAAVQAHFTYYGTR